MRHFRALEFGIVPGVYNELPFDSNGKTGDYCGDAIGVLFDVARDGKPCRASCLCKLFLQIKGLELVEGNDRVCMRVNECPESSRKEEGGQGLTCQDHESADLFDNRELLNPAGKLVHRPSQRSSHLQIIYATSQETSRQRLAGEKTVGLVDLVDAQSPCGGAYEQLVACAPVRRGGGWRVLPCARMTSMRSRGMSTTAHGRKAPSITPCTGPVSSRLDGAGLQPRGL